MNRQLVELCRRQKAMQEESAKAQAAAASSGGGGGSDKTSSQQHHPQTAEIALRRALLMERVENGNSSSSSSNAANSNGIAGTGGAPPCVFQLLHVDQNIAQQLRAKLRANGERLDGDALDDAAPSKKGSLQQQQQQQQQQQTPSSSSQQGSSVFASKRVHVKQIHIPLTSGMDRQRLSNMKSTLKDEYAARYCESLGVAPTPQNTSLVQKLMPFERCRVYQSTVNVGGRGERRNQIVIEPSPLPTLEAVQALAGPVGEGVLETLLDADRAEEAETKLRQSLPPSAGGLGSKPTTASASSPGGDAAVPPAAGATPSSHAAQLLQQAMSFESYKSKFVFPYCLPNKFEAHRTMGEEEAEEEAVVVEHVPAPPTAPKQPTAKTASPPVAKKLDLQNQLLQRAMASGTTTGGMAGSSSGSGLRGIGLGGLSDSDRRAIESIVASPSTAATAHQPPAEGKVDESGEVSEDGGDTAPGGEGQSSSGKPSGGGGEARVSPNRRLRFSDREAVNLAIHRELDAACSATTTAATAIDSSEVKLMQQQFVRNFPFSRFADRLTPEEIQRTKGLALSSTIATILQSLLQFLLVVYLQPFTTGRYAADDVSSPDNLFLKLYKELLLFSSDTTKRAASGACSAAASAAELGLCLLCVRVVVDGWVSVHMPAFAACRTGRSVLQRMDHLVLALIDPMGLASHISVVESTPAALKFLRSRKLPEKVHSAVTSPLILFIVGDGACSHEVKKFALQKPQCVEEGLQELRRHLTPLVRSQLLRAITEEKLKR